MNLRLQLALLLLFVIPTFSSRASSPLVDAAASDVADNPGGDTSKLEAMIAAGADVNQRDDNGSTALFYAGKRQAEILIAHGADVNARNKNGDAPLHVHARILHPTAVPVLIANGADVNARNRYGNTPLGEAVGLSNPERFKVIADALIAAHADINAVNNIGYTPLLGAVSTSNAYAVKYLIRHGANLDTQETAMDCSALHLAVQSYCGASAFHFSVFQFGEIIDVLLAAGANVNLLNRSGDTMLIEASVSGCPDIAAKLIAHGAKLELNANSYGYTPLISATYSQKIDVVRVLLDAGAKVNATDKSGRTALDWARMKNDSEIEALLIKYGAH
jgi:ankyrin repeat protein